MGESLRQKALWVTEGLCDAHLQRNMERAIPEILWMIRENQESRLCLPESLKKTFIFLMCTAPHKLILIYLNRDVKRFGDRVTQEEIEFLCQAESEINRIYEAVPHRLGEDEQSRMDESLDFLCKSGEGELSLIKSRYRKDKKLYGYNERQRNRDFFFALLKLIVKESSYKERSRDKYQEIFKIVKGVQVLASKLNDLI